MMAGTNQDGKNGGPSSSMAPTKHEGVLSKWTNVVRGWQNRWFVLDPVHCTLEYYLTEEDRGQSPRAVVKLPGATVSPSSEDAQIFVLHSANGEVYKFKAHDTKERQKWVNLLRCVISPNYGLNEPAIPPRSNSTGPPSTPGGGSAGGQERESTPRTSSLNRSYSPPPAYSAVMAGRSFSSEPATVKFEEPFGPARNIIAKIRDKRMEMCKLIEHSNPADDPSTAGHTPDLLLLKSTSLAQWDCLHQCLFALMNTDVPETTGTGYCGVNTYDLKQTPQTAQQRDVDTSTPFESPQGSSSGGSGKEGTPRSSSVQGGRVEGLTTASPAPEQRRSVSPAPIRTLANSEEAAETPPPTVEMPILRGKNLPVTEEAEAKLVVVSAETPPAKPNPGPRSRSSSGSGVPPKILRQDSRPPAFADDQEEVTDEEETDSGELGSVESEKSVILHLIGQLKIGMDLTKVTLPTFILERRSLLEMFADYMGHAYVLLRISDMETPEQRMLAVLEWYLTSFHIVRKGTQAKKPYNPIIGETFHCSWKVPGESSAVASSEIAPSSTGPKSLLRLKYVGEQVSHHPPVTAFYVECPEKKLCMNASIYTQSKFYGLSIGVNMIGMAKLSVIQYGEEYTFTLPSAYARSILTVPWCELGGKVQLECKKSGYSAEVVFHTKPFYGGKLHRVTADVVNPQGKVACKVSGEWNGSFEFAMTNESQNKSASKTIDISSLPVIRKRCRPMDKQDPFESRRLWKKVTEALATENIERATQEKNALEEVQRREEKQRKINDQRFPNKFFHLEDGNWIFNTPLDKRSTSSPSSPASRR
ncbi:oxysterol-binding protein-related protein 10-like [Paramacrobiotus metropolitanus]|uniref:oxysterol-binding protein-related protein 10-like n=1 Tax=Paramacrobiotus metropolitanus TaxID=2943436 RepID=UPI002446016F|nr:oxysterol-binding protein-related protein 10-like [Paramacrobiotus metropolitanus]